MRTLRTGFLAPLWSFAKWAARHQRNQETEKLSLKGEVSTVSTMGRRKVLHGFRAVSGRFPNGFHGFRATVSRRFPGSLETIQVPYDVVVASDPFGGHQFEPVFVEERLLGLPGFGISGHLLQEPKPDAFHPPLIHGH